MKKRKKRAFTLTEILIALTIIGVISAVTVPVLMQNTNKQEYVTALQKAYSVLSQAANQITAEEGSPKCSDGGWACTNEDIYNLYKKHLNVIKDCGTAPGCFNQLGSANRGYKRIRGTYLRSEWNMNSRNDWYKLILNDGMQLLFFADAEDCIAGSDENTYSRCYRIFADINGEKGPNQWGRDGFWFQADEAGVLQPLHNPNSDSISTSKCDLYDDTNDGGAGWGCAWKVLREGAMNY